MPEYEIIPDSIPELEEALDLYDSVGWSAYTQSPQTLQRALDQSAFVVLAREDSGRLIGLARAISDDATICYLQDILVHPAAQRRAVGQGLFRAVEARFAHVRQFVLITDDEPRQREFYQAMGLDQATDAPENDVKIRTFLRFG